MKLKFYLRGLGIGMVVTALLMGFTTKGNEMSDEEIKARAMELGMVEQRTLADIRDNTPEASKEASKEATKEATKQPTEEYSGSETGGDGQQTDQTTAENGQQTDQTTAENNQQAGATKTEKPQETALPTETLKPLNTEAPEATEVPQRTEVPTAVPEKNEEETESNREPKAEVQGDLVQLSIFEGNNSVNVSKALAEAGLVKDAAAFDRYLIKNGYSKIINTGTYLITFGTSEADIARIITNKK